MTWHPFLVLRGLIAREDPFCQRSFSKSGESQHRTLSRVRFCPCIQLFLLELTDFTSQLRCCLETVSIQDHLHARAQRRICP